MKRHASIASRKLALDFMVRHPWLQEGASPDVVLMLALDDIVSATGLDPAGARYWFVLEQNLRAALPHRFPDPIVIKTSTAVERLAVGMTKAAQLGRVHGDAVLSLRKRGAGNSR